MDEAGSIHDAALVDAWRLPPSVLAYLDWTTGLLRVNVESADFESLAAGQSPKSELFDETICHELFHACQICSSGFLYNHVLSLSRAIWLETFQLDSDELLTDKFEAAVTPAPEATRLIAALYVPGPDGISIVDLVESYAFLAHHLILQPTLSARAYQFRMIDLVGTHYHRGFALMEHHFAARACALLCPLFHEALSFAEPLPALSCLIEQTKTLSHGSEASPADIADLISRASEAVHRRFHRVQSPVDQPGNHADAHPFYQRTLRAIRDTVSAEEFRRQMRFPQMLGKPALTTASQPILFNDTATYLPEGFGSGLFDDEEEHRDMIVILAVLSFRHLRRCAEPAFFRLEHCSPACHE